MCHKNIRIVWVTGNTIAIGQDVIKFRLVGRGSRLISAAIIWPWVLWFFFIVAKGLWKWLEWVFMPLKKSACVLMMCFSRQRKSKQVESNEGAHQREGKSKKALLHLSASQIESSPLLRFWERHFCIPPTRSRQNPRRVGLDGVGGRPPPEWFFRRCGHF